MADPREQEGTIMSIIVDRNRVTIYRLSPEDIERFLSDKYGGKIRQVNTGGLARARQKREIYAAACRKTEVEAT